MKPQAAMGNQMNPALAQQQMQQNPNIQGMLGGMGPNIQQLLQQRMAGPPPMPGNPMQGMQQNQLMQQMQGVNPGKSMPNFQNILQQIRGQGGTIQSGMPTGNMQGGMNPLAQQLKKTGMNPAIQPTVTSKMRPTMKSDMSSKPPALKFSNPQPAGRMKATGPQNSAAAIQRVQQGIGKFNRGGF